MAKASVKKPLEHNEFYQQDPTEPADFAIRVAFVLAMVGACLAVLFGLIVARITNFEIEQRSLQYGFESSILQSPLVFTRAAYWMGIIEGAIVLTLLSISLDIYIRSSWRQTHMNHQDVRWGGALLALLMFLTTVYVAVVPMLWYFFPSIAWVIFTAIFRRRQVALRRLLQRAQAPRRLLYNRAEETRHRFDKWGLWTTALFVPLISTGVALTFYGAVRTDRVLESFGFGWYAGTSSTYAILLGWYLVIAATRIKVRRNAG